MDHADNRTVRLASNPAFEIECTPLPTPEGKWWATMIIRRLDGAFRQQITVPVGCEVFDKEREATEAAREAAEQWLREHRLL
jgi:hypothetical protein